MNTTQSISVIIRTYTEARWDYLVSSVTSVQQQSLPPLEIVLVVDHNQALLERVRARFPDTTIVENHEPQGSSGAWNSGIAAARGDILAFLDDDAIAAPDWLEQLSKPYIDPSVVGVGGLIDPLWLSGKPAWFPEEFQWVVGCSYRGLPEAIGPVRNLIGCNMSFRREVFDHFGGFRKGMGHVGGKPIGCDETELCIRVRQNWPHKIYLHNPYATVKHQIPANRTRWSYFLSRCYLEGCSKALVAHYVGSKDGLAAERKYSFQTLPQGILRGIAGTIQTRRPDGILRAGAIVAGVVTAGIGYLRSTLPLRFAQREQIADEAHILQGEQVV